MCCRRLFPTAVGWSGGAAVTTDLPSSVQVQELLEHTSMGTTDPLRGRQQENRCRGDRDTTLHNSPGIDPMPLIPLLNRRKCLPIHLQESESAARQNPSRIIGVIKLWRPLNRILSSTRRQNCPLPHQHKGRSSISRNAPRRTLRIIEIRAMCPSLDRQS